MTIAESTEQYVANLLAQRWEQTSQKILDLADAIPADNFESTPVAGLRTCGAVIRHVAFWNRYVADSLAGKAANDSGNELSLAELPDQQSLRDELMRSAREVTSAIRNRKDPLSPQHCEMLVTFVEHTSEHYGQLAVYARLMDIVPPASRP
jgi:uncharacterized damage-inducible protein DinB